MSALAELAFGEAGLLEAWREVERRDARDGVVAPAIARFRENAEERLASLGEELRTGAYRPAPLSEVRIEAGGKRRVLHIPAVRDRIVARSVLTACGPMIDPLLGPSAFGYRPGLGVADAVQAVVEGRQAGLEWVLRTDVDECFPTVPAATAAARFAAAVRDERLSSLVADLLARPVGTGRLRGSPLSGLPQGCPLSPLLMNLVLVDLDDALNEAGLLAVRYADDIAVLGERRADLELAIRIASDALGEHGMRLGEAKTQLMTFEEGFAFLGEDFGPKYPPFLPLQHVPEPDDRVLYIGVQGARLRIAKGRLLVESGEEAPLLDLPSGQVNRVVVFGAVGVTAGVRSWALDRGVDIVLASRRGSFLGVMSGTRTLGHSARIVAQVRMQDDPRRLELGRRIVEAKARKQIVLLQRFGRRASAQTLGEAVRRMRAYVDMLDEAQTPDELLGLEGAVAKEYFAALGGLFPEGLAFETRSRRPPMDLANAALSFLYTVLCGECVTAVRAAGMEPALGVLHTAQEKRPSLALDLLEEFRPLIVDQAVLSAARHRRLLPEHARQESGKPGVLLTKKGREVVLNAYEERMQQFVRGSLPDFAGTLRRHLFRQAQRLAGAITDSGREWTGLSWRR